MIKKILSILAFPFIFIVSLLAGFILGTIDTFETICDIYGGIWK